MLEFFITLILLKNLGIKIPDTIKTFLLWFFGLLLYSVLALLLESIFKPAPIIMLILLIWFIYRKIKNK